MTLLCPFGGYPVAVEVVDVCGGFYFLYYDDGLLFKLSFDPVIHEKYSRAVVYIMGFSYAMVLQDISLEIYFAEFGFNLF